MPGYKDHRNDVRDAGIDEVLVYCVNDPAVMEAGAKDQKIAGTNISFFDGRGGSNPPAACADISRCTDAGGFCGGR